jgi:hypothetical protein
MLDLLQAKAESRDHAKKAAQEPRRQAGAMGPLAWAFPGKRYRTPTKEPKVLKGAGPDTRGLEPEPEAGLHGGCRRNTQESTMENWRIKRATELDLPLSRRARCGNPPW